MSLPSELNLQLQNSPKQKKVIVSKAKKKKRAGKVKIVT